MASNVRHHQHPADQQTSGGRDDSRPRESRTYIDARGRECRETNQVKRNGDSKYEVKCKARKHSKHAKHHDYDDDYDDYDDDRDSRSSREQRCVTVFGARHCTVASGGSYPSRRPDPASTVIWGRGSWPSRRGG